MQGRDRKMNVEILKSRESSQAPFPTTSMLLLFSVVVPQSTVAACSGQTTYFTPPVASPSFCVCPATILACLGWNLSLWFTLLLTCTCNVVLFLTLS